LSVIADGEGDGGIEDGDILIKIAEVSVSLKEKSFDEIRNVAVEQIGPDKYVDAVAVAAIFNSLDRVANATGIPIEQTKVEMTEGVRKNLGLDQMATAKLPNQKSADDILSQKPDWGPSTHEGL
jgi:hypothetical protein